MDSALTALITSAAGTGAPTLPSSRYYGAQTQQFTLPNGTPVMYLARRIVPQPATYSTRSYVIVEGDRLDNLAARFLGDPLLYWTICDASGVTDPDALTLAPDSTETANAAVGQTIHIPAAPGIPPGARSG